MAQNGMFRNAFRGFNKQDVLQYIDEITAAWDEERKALEKRAEDAEAAQIEAQNAAQAAADEAASQVAAAQEQQQAVEAQLSEVQQQLANTANDLAVAATTIEEMATQLEEAQRRTAQLERELATTAEERDTAIAALADAKTQLDDSLLTQRQLEESRRLVNSQTEQIASMNRTIQRYESVLGSADTMEEKIGSLIRPCIHRTVEVADEVLESAEMSLAGMICQLDDIKSCLNSLRTEVQNAADDSDARLTTILDQWLAAAQDADGNGSGFFQ